MSKSVAEGILRGARQALAFADGTGDLRKYRVHIPHEIDVRRIRTKLGMTQAQFARAFGFSIDNLRHWEQGQRVPDGAARAYLRVIDLAPKAVQKALGGLKDPRRVPIKQLRFRRSIRPATARKPSPIVTEHLSHDDE